MKKILVLYFIIIYQAQAQNKISEAKKTEPIKGLTFILPANFSIMNDDDIAQKYPTYKKPLAMYNSQDKEADFGVNHAVNRWYNANLTILRDMYKSTINSVFTNVDYIQEGVIKTINGRNFIVFEFTSELTEEKRIDEKDVRLRTYSFMCYTLHDAKILVFNFTTRAHYQSKWAPVAATIMNSITISPKLKVGDFTPYKVDRPLPKTNLKNDPQMEAIKRLRENNKEIPK